MGFYTVGKIYDGRVLSKYHIIEAESVYSRAVEWKK